MSLENNINKKSSGFKTPEAYFKSFEDRLFKKLSEQESSNPSLIPQKTGFEVPEAYFESVEKSIIDQAIDKNKGKVIPLWINKLAKVAAVLLILITGYGILKINNTSQLEENNFSNISEADLELYIENYIFPYSEMQNLFISNNSFELAESNLSDLNQEIILQYFDNELDDLDLLDE